MSTAADTNAKPAEEFVVYSEALPEDKTSGNPEPQLSLDTQTIPEPQVNRIDSFPRTLPLPASSVLSPTSAPSIEQDIIRSLSKQEAPPTTAGPQDIVSPPESEATDSSMYIQTRNITAPSGESDLRATTPLAELAGTDFDQAVAVRRRGASVTGEEISGPLEDLKVEDTPAPAKEKKAAPVFTEEMLKARKADPAVVATLPLTPSAEDFEVAKTHEGARFNPEYPHAHETKVAS